MRNWKEEYKIQAAKNIKLEDAIVRLRNLNWQYVEYIETMLQNGTVPNDEEMRLMKEMRQLLKNSQPI